MRTRENNDDAVDELERWTRPEGEQLEDAKFFAKTIGFCLVGIGILVVTAWALGGFS